MSGTFLNTVVSQLRTVVRGFSAERDRWNELKELMQIGEMQTFEDFKNYTISRSGDHESYEGIRHRLRFRVNQPIILHGFGFFGPHDEMQANYTVFVDVENSEGNIISSNTLENVIAARGSIFSVGLKSPVNIHGDKYYSVLFQLEGPDTDFCPLEKLQTEIGNFSGDEIAFQFELGTKQLPVMYYTSIFPDPKPN